MTHFLIMPIGAPGSGKSTLRRELVERGAIAQEAVVSPDHYRRLLTGQKGNQTENGRVFSIVDSIAQARLFHGLDVYLDATNLNADLRAKYVEWAQASGAKIVYLVPNVTLEELEERNDHRDNPVPFGVLERMFNAADAITEADLPGGRVLVIPYGSAMEDAAVWIQDYLVHQELMGKVP